MLANAIKKVDMKQKKDPPKNSDKKPYTYSKTSPKRGRRGCLCLDNTYDVSCCDGAIYSQGIGRDRA